MPKLQIPQALFCSITSKTMIDPVITQNGLICEYEAFKKQFKKINFKDSVEGKDFIKSALIRKISLSLFNEYAFCSEDDFCCPITTQIMEKPVMTCDGQVYEKKVIEDWLLTHNTSPST